MPGVDVYSRGSIHGDFGPSARDSLKQSVRRFGAVHFTVADRALSERDFSFKFHRPEDGDELTNDIIVRIRLHEFEERLAHLDDNVSGEMAYYIAEGITKFFTREIIIGVELMTANVMWGTASTMD